MQPVRIRYQLISVTLIAVICLHTWNGHALPVLSLLPDVSDITSILDTVLATPVALLNFLASLIKDELKDRPDITFEDGVVCDYVLAGLGSAGAVLANRLSEISELKVCCVEAGGNEKFLMDVPLLANYIQFTEANWKYRTEVSDSYCLGLDDQRCNWPRGKVLGGSSNLNYMIATRGNPRDYDRWAELGNDGWSWKDVFPYFKKLEQMQILDLASDEEYHNTKGPMKINYPVNHTKLATAFLKAGQELGYEVLDYNGEKQTGFSYLQTTTTNGERMSTNRAYLEPIMDRTNLLISMYSMASRIIINETEKRAVGIEYIKSGIKRTIRARKEVILCTGTIGTSQLLMLSGIGPAQHLAEMGIPLIQDAPVGQNLMDHIGYGGFVFTIKTPDTILTKDVVNPLKPSLSQYSNKRQGYFTIPGGTEALGFITVNTTAEAGWPDMELLFAGASLASDIGARKGFGITDELWAKLYGNVTDKYAWSVLPMIMRPLSRGQILLADTNIATHPRIIPNYLNRTEDVQIGIGGIRAAQKIMASKAMAQFGSELHKVDFPECKSFEYDSDGYWECALRILTFNLYHYAGTAKMGLVGDPTAVVNPKLQVHGVNGLRVCDASIMPEIVTGHTNIPIIMSAEKLADMLKEELGLGTKK